VGCPFTQGQLPPVVGGEKKINAAACTRRSGPGPAKGFPTFELHPQFG